MISCKSLYILNPIGLQGVTRILPRKCPLPPEVRQIVRRYGWVTAHQPVIGGTASESLLGRMRERGLDIGQFRRVLRTPA